MKKIDMAILSRLISELREAVLKTGFGRVVVGLSGGIDSAVSAALAVRALGSENVFGFFMPYRDSSPQSADDAALFAELFCIKLETVDITLMAGQYTDKCAYISKNRLGNILSRLRMTVLFDKSAVYDALVLGTGNKSEILLGYMTWFGDSACAINPLGDLYKTQVREAARFLDIPERIIMKAPSADHYEGQTDEHDLGSSYEEIDKVLSELIEDENTELLKASGVNNITDRVKRNGYKRKLPIIIGVGQKALW
ncbi:MAG: NAD+ synthase [Deferribacteraceae bacterium]|jgi:NAD+ synthase|nr:NAD+ synthase [Deferribacteraceae bacterium]